MLEQVDDAELPERQPNVLSYRVVAADLILALEITDPNGVSDRPHIFFFRKNDSAGNSSLRLDFADLDHAANFYEVIDSFVSSWERYIKFVPLALTLCSGNELELLSDYRVRSRLGRENIDIGTKGRIVVAASAKSRTIKKKGAKTTAKNSKTMHNVTVNNSNSCLKPIARIGKTYTYDAVDLAEFMNANPVFSLHRDK